MASEGEKLIRSVITECWGKSDLALVDKCYSRDCVSHQPLMGDVKRDGIKDAIQKYHRAFPDLRVEVLSTIGQGDTFVTRWRAEGTNNGEFFGAPPSGRRSIIEGVSCARIENGVVVEEWNYYDTLSLLQTIGIVPELKPSEAPPPQARPS